jgi:hypothetical protein
VLNLLPSTKLVLVDAKRKCKTMDVTAKTILHLLL